MRAGGERKQKKRVNADTYVFAVLVFISFSLLFFSSRSFVIDFGSLGLSMYSGIRGGISGVISYISRTVLSVQELAVLRREYGELLDRMIRYEQLERNAAEIRQENNRLREQLGFTARTGYHYIPAEIIGRDPDNLFSAFVINKGKRDGVAYNMPVIAYQKGMQALTGKILQAGQFESLVIPIYDVSCFVPARLAESRYDGLVEGQGKREYPLLMRLISKRARDEIGIGDTIITSGVGGVYPGAVYPGGINIGRVSKINYQEYETSMEVELEPAIDFSRLEYVFVIDVKEEDG
ncbi:MAG: rod shape-determining protein MreC [Spirochaetaceae bacterium]|jgi:rod shape-determining protein MreC|nr:rod shape-determining protein MreC [Spirochaetaceae bacterium]